MHVTLCTAEVRADDTPAIEAVLNADTKRMQLLEEVLNARDCLLRINPAHLILFPPPAGEAAGASE